MFYILYVKIFYLIWHSYKTKHKSALQNTQRRANKKLPGMRDLSYIERLKLLKIPTLVYRRLRGDMIDVYKIIHNMIYYHESVPNLLRNNEISQRTGNKGHSLKLFTQRAKVNLRKIYFQFVLANHGIVSLIQW